VVLSLVILPKEPVPKVPLEIELVKVKPAPPIIKKKIKKVVKSKKSKRRKKRKTKKIAVAAKKAKPRFKYTPKKSVDSFFNKTVNSMSSRYVKKEKLSLKTLSTIPDVLDKHSSIEEYKPREMPKVKSFVTSNIFPNERQDRKNKHIEEPKASVADTSPKKDAILGKIVWESGISRKRIYSPPLPGSDSPISGKVIVVFWVDSAGFVTKCNIKKRLSGRQDQIAKNYVRGFKFEPDYSLETGERHKGSITILFENPY